MAEYKERPKRKVVSKIRMPAAARRGGYEVPEEITEVREEEDPVYSHMEVDPMTGKEYAPRGVEEAELLPATPLGLAEAGVAYAGKKAVKAGAKQLGKAIEKRAAKRAAKEEEQFLEHLKPSPKKEYNFDEFDEYIINKNKNKELGIEFEDWWDKTFTDLKKAREFYKNDPDAEDIWYDGFEDLYVVRVRPPKKAGGE